ncbi:MAG: alanine racemase [Mesorhizobium sp.]
MIDFASAAAGAVLTIDLHAIAENWRRLGQMSGAAECAAVVKADAYGLGAAQVATALQEAGCRTFFVAHLEEGIALRAAIGPGSRIFVLHGAPAGTEAGCMASGLIPVINTASELARWRGIAASSGTRPSIAVQVDSGMTRLGMSQAEVEVLTAADFHGLSVELILSHLARADEPDQPASAQQRVAFERLRKLLPAAKASLANSSGVYLGGGYQYDLARPGAALYGINPTPGRANPMLPVVTLSARIMQMRDVAPDTGVGYGHAVRTGRASRLATICLGYADGWPRNSTAGAFFHSQPMPLFGRVSMDSIILDATDCVDIPAEGDFVELIGEYQTVDDVAQSAGTIGYEILTRLGRRFNRRYV